MPRSMLKRRIDTRLAWLGLTHRDFSAIIGMDKSSFSRALRANRPRQGTIDRISMGLGLTSDQLMDAEDTDVLVCPHPAFDGRSLERIGVEERVEILTRWVGDHKE